VDVPEVQQDNFDIVEYTDSKKNELRQSIQEKKLKNVPCDQLSMGMSRDYDMAIQNGSTFVRIGSAFFKENGE
ncbi:MAG: hypothetical protein KHW83_05335, partial [Streptococcus sp.]|nr:hypothetical protein [Streptococcus sp.]